MSLVYFQLEHGVFIARADAIVALQELRKPTQSPVRVILKTGQQFDVKNSMDDCQARLIAAQTITKTADKFEAGEGSEASRGLIEPVRACCGNYDQCERPCVPRITHFAEREMKTLAEKWRHVANEWADTTYNALQHLRNVRDGITKPEDAIRNMEVCVAHCRDVNDSTYAETRSKL